MARSESENEMSKRSSALTPRQVDDAYEVIKCISNNRKIQMALKEKDMQDHQWLKNMDEQVALKICMDVLQEEGCRITFEEP